LELNEESSGRGENVTDSSVDSEINQNPGESMKLSSENAGEAQNVTDSMKVDPDDLGSAPQSEPIVLTLQNTQHEIKVACDTITNQSADISEPEVKASELDTEARKNVTVENEMEKTVDEVITDISDPEEVKPPEVDTSISLGTIHLAIDIDKKDNDVEIVNLTDVSNNEKMGDEKTFEEKLSADNVAIENAENCLNECKEDDLPKEEKNDINDCEDMENETTGEQKCDVNVHKDSENETTMAITFKAESINDYQTDDNKAEDISPSSAENCIVSNQEDPPKLEASSDCENCVQCDNNQDLPNASRNHITVEATIETPPVSDEIDLCETKDPDTDTTEKCQESGGDLLRNDAEYDSIDMEGERTVAIENPNYSATCQAEYKPPLDSVDDLHSKVHVDVNGEDTHNSQTLPSIPSSVEERKSSSARSASMEELTVHSSHIYEEIEKKRPIIYRRFSDKTDNKKVICTSPDPDGKKIKKKKSRSSSFSEFFRNPTKYKLPGLRNKKSKGT
jgi:hypothetical protein